MKTTKCACGRPTSKLLLGLESRYVCDDCYSRAIESLPRTEPRYYVGGTSPNDQLTEVSHAQWRAMGN